MDSYCVVCAVMDSYCVVCAVMDSYCVAGAVMDSYCVVCAVMDSYCVACAVMDLYAVCLIALTFPLVCTVWSVLHPQTLTQHLVYADHLLQELLQVPTVLQHNAVVLCNHLNILATYCITFSQN